MFTKRILYKYILMVTWYIYLALSPRKIFGPAPAPLAYTVDGSRCLRSSKALCSLPTVMIVCISQYEPVYAIALAK